MTNEKEWLDQLRDKKLFRWDKEPGFITQHPIGVCICDNASPKSWDPHQAIYSYELRNLRNNSNNPITGLGYISMGWENSKNIGNHPSRITCSRITSFFDHQNWQIPYPNKPILSIANLSIFWNKISPYRPGPAMIDMFNYSEYWKENTMVEQRCSRTVFKWWNQFATLGPPDWEVVSENRDTKEERELLSLLKSTQSPITPLKNNFFNSSTDEFRFMDIIQRANK
jgi:hypothetical protein